MPTLTPRPEPLATGENPGPQRARSPALLGTGAFNRPGIAPGRSGTLPVWGLLAKVTPPQLRLPLLLANPGYVLHPYASPSLIARATAPERLCTSSFP